MSLRVRDLAESIEFYEDVLGLHGQPATPTARAWRGEAGPADPDEPPSLCVELIAGRPAHAQPSIGEFSVRVDSPAAVNRIHGRAAARHARTSRPRRVDHRWRCSIFDPDGHKVEVFAAISPHEMPPVASTPPRGAAEPDDRREEDPLAFAQRDKIEDATMRQRIRGRR